MEDDIYLLCSMDQGVLNFYCKNFEVRKYTMLSITLMLREKG